MKWRHEYKQKPTTGAQRTVRKFLWRPLTLFTLYKHEPRETRWLEWANIEQFYCHSGGWVDTYWGHT